MLAGRLCPARPWIAEVFLKTESTRGSRAGRGAGVAALLFLVGGMLSSPTVAGTRTPLDGLGNLEFVADLPVFPTGGSAGRVDVAVRVDHDQIRFGRGGGTARFVVHLKLAREGRVAVDTTQVFHAFPPHEAPPDSTRLSRFELFEMSVRVPEGRWAVTLDVSESRDDAREGRHGRAAGVLEVPRVPLGVARLSDPEFRLRSGGRSLPNPARIYGVVQDTLETYLELRGGGPGTSRNVGVEIIDPLYGRMVSQTLALNGETDPAAALFRLPLVSLPAGNYILRLVPSWPDAAPSETEFTVNWRVDRILGDSRALALEAELVLPPKDFVHFQELSRAAQAQWLEEFWARVDPTPETPLNERKQRFLQRVAYAWKHFGEFGTPGPLSDRGRIYIRYGPPAEVSVEVLPSNGSDLDEAIEAVHDAHAPQVEGVTARGELNKEEILGLERAGRTRLETVLRDRYRNQSRVGTEGSFELWTYRMQGDPLFEAPARWSEDVDLRFLFVDREGVGVYHLDFSNLATQD